MNNINYLGMIGSAQLAAIVGLFSLIPMTLIVIAGVFSSLDNEKRFWLKRLLTSVDPSINSEQVGVINKHAEDNKDTSIYKGFKVYLGYGATLLAMMGLLLILVDGMKDRESFKALTFLPLVFGLILFTMYRMAHVNSKFWKELSVSFLFAGFAVTFLSAIQVYEVDTIRGEVQIYIVLLAGLFLMYRFNSLLTSYLYLLAMSGISLVLLALILAVFGGGIMPRMDMSTFELKNDMLKHLIWPFALAVVPFVVRRLKAAENITLKESILGILFLTAILSTAVAGSSGLVMISLTIVTTTLYIFSKAFFQKGTWFFHRPIQTLIILGSIILAFIFSIRETMDVVGQGYSSFKSYLDIEIDQVITLLFVGSIGATGYYMYKNYILKDGIKLNYFVLAFPLAMFFCLFIGEFGYVVMTAYAVGLGYTYGIMGLNDKNTTLIILGSMVLLGIVTIKLIINIVDVLDNPTATQIGLVLILMGALRAGMVFFMRTKWALNDDNQESNIDSPLDDIKGAFTTIKDDLISSKKDSKPAPVTEQENEVSNEDSNTTNETKGAEEKVNNDETLDTSDKIQKLEQLAELKEKGLLTDEEFELEKKKILGK